MEKRLPRLPVIFISLIFLLFTVLCSGIVYMQAKSWNSFKQTAQPTEAVITDITTQRTTTGAGKNRHKKTRHTVHVKYTVDGQNYSTTLNYYTSGMHKGGKVTLYYDPEDPSKTMSNPIVINIILGVLAAVFFLVFLLALITEFKECILINRLIESNTYYLCDDWIEETAPVTVNNVRYHQIKCNIVDDRGNKHTFISPAFHPAKSPYSQGDMIKIYVIYSSHPEITLYPNIRSKILTFN